MAESSPSTPLPPAGCAASEEMANTEFYSDELDERGTQGAADRMLSAASARGTPTMGDADRTLAACSLNFSQPAAEEVQVEDDDEQGRVDRALNALIYKHKLDPNIFVSDEWEDLIEALNNGPLPALETVYDATLAVLLARATVHQVQARLLCE